MTNLQAAQAETTEAFLAEAGPKLASLCTACGACFDACPMVDHIGLRAVDARSATGGLRALATGEAGSVETVSWVGACTKSGLCVDVCPQKDAGLDAMLLIRIAKQRALNDTHQLPVKNDPTLFPRVKIFARLQLSSEELAKWM